MADGAPIAPGSGLGVATDEVATNLTGTVAKNGTITVTGTGTLFLSELSVGQIIRIPGTATEDRIVAAIASDLSLTVTVAFVNTASGQTGQRVQHVQYVKLMDATADSVAKIAGDAANGIDVDVTRLPVVVIKEDQPAATTATWTSATGVNTAATATVTNYASATVSIQTPTTVTAGVITLEVSDDAGTTYYPAGTVRVENGQQEYVVTLALTPGIVLNRAYQVGLQGFTNLRARLSTVIVGAGNTLVRISPMGAPAEKLVANRVRQVATYRALYRTTGATRPYFLTNTFAAAGRKQYATIHHAAAAVKTVKLRRVQFMAETNTVAATNYTVDLVRITTAPVTGNPAITPAVTDSIDPAAEATCLALPTTAATESASFFGMAYYAAGISGGIPTTYLATPGVWVDLFAPSHDESKLPTIRAGVLEGWAVTVDGNNSTNVFHGYVLIEFTEETP